MKSQLNVCYLSVSSLDDAVYKFVNLGALEETAVLVIVATIVNVSAIAIFSRAEMLQSLCKIDCRGCSLNSSGRNSYMRKTYLQNL